MYSKLTIKEIEELLKSKEIIIYGTGHIGKKFLLALKKLGLYDNIFCFAKTDDVEAGETIENIPVYKISQITMKDNSLVCLAVHDSICQELILEVEKTGIEEYVWIYPYLYELLLGAPSKENVRLNVNDLRESSKSDYRMAIRFLAIEEYLKKNTCGFDMYINAFLLQCDEKTAKKRLEKFCNLIESWISSGYDSSYKIQVSQNLEIIDGNHRAALAMYFDEKDILCDMFELPFPIVTLHGEGAMLTRDILLKSGFSWEEMNLLEEMMERL